MVVWINKDVVRANTNQRALVLKTVRRQIFVQLLGTDEKFVVQPHHVVGVEIDDSLTINFKCTGVRTCELWCYGCENQEQSNA